MGLVGDAKGSARKKRQVSDRPGNALRAAGCGRILIAVTGGCIVAASHVGEASASTVIPSLASPEPDWITHDAT